MPTLADQTQHGQYHKPRFLLHTPKMAKVLSTDRVRMSPERACHRRPGVLGTDGTTVG